MTPPSADLGRLVKALAALDERVCPTDACPTPEKIWAASRGELRASRARLLLDHAASCGACAEAWRLAREVGAELPEPVIARRRPLMGWAAAAVVAAALVVVVLVPTLREEPGGGTIRQEDRPAVRSLIAEDRPLPRAALVLRWEGPKGARYDVEVARDDIAPIARQRGLTVTEYHVPPQALDGLPPGSRLFWRVEAELPDGTRIASPTFLVRLD